MPVLFLRQCVEIVLFLLVPFSVLLVLVVRFWLKYARDESDYTPFTRLYKRYTKCAQTKRSEHNYILSIGPRGARSDVGSGSSLGATFRPYVSFHPLCLRAMVTMRIERERKEDVEHQCNVIRITYLHNDMSTYTLLLCYVGRGLQPDSPGLRHPNSPSRRRIQDSLLSGEWIECNILCVVLRVVRKCRCMQLHT